MSLSVLIYSPDNIRGKIILKTIHLENIDAVLCSSYAAIGYAVLKREPDVIIFDTKNNFQEELDFLKMLPEKLPHTTRIILAEPQDISFLKYTDLGDDLFTPEPFHPEFILSLVKAILESKLKKKVFSKAA
jgi:DNA-binding NtrC family response regulator